MKVIFTIVDGLHCVAFRELNATFPTTLHAPAHEKK
jgi:hypothetical protein